ncbi:hypothetical protein KI387_036832, partial [Taxus chinensis]
IWEFMEAHQRWHPTAEFAVPGEDGEQVYAISWAPNIGRPYELIAIASSKGVSIWHIELDPNINERPKLKRVATLSGHDGEVWQLDWDMGGMTLATSGNDGTVRLWQSNTNGVWQEVAVILLTPQGFGVTVHYIWYQSDHPGGHINSAVTLGLFQERNFSLLRAMFYMIRQCLGAICGAGVVKGFQRHPYKMVGDGCNSVAHGYTEGDGLGAEIFGTFVLVYTIFSATDAKRSARESHFPVVYCVARHDMPNNAAPKTIDRNAATLRDSILFSVKLQKLYNAVRVDIKQHCSVDYRKLDFFADNKYEYGIDDPF